MYENVVCICIYYTVSSIVFLSLYIGTGVGGGWLCYEIGSNGYLCKFTVSLTGSIIIHQSSCLSVLSLFHSISIVYMRTLDLFHDIVI